MKKTVYIVDDEPKLRDMFTTVLSRDGFNAQAFMNPPAMLDQLDGGHVPDVILTDLVMPAMSGIELLEVLRERNEQVPVIVMTGNGSVQTAVEAMRLGAFHYLQKPINLEEMRALLARALADHGGHVAGKKGSLAHAIGTAAKGGTAAKNGSASKKGAESGLYPISGILGQSEAIERVRETIRTLRDIPNTTVLITGETGTGKNLVAKTIHHNSVYNDGRFMEINCAALPDNLLEAELFGYEKGAFTDARASKPGLLEVADGGTLFLDEIDSMSPGLQAKLLSFLENRTFRRLGGVEEIRVTTRILCATNARLEERVAQKEFRKDLFFRINVVNLHLPPLRMMGRDILKIAHHIVGEYARDLDRSVEGFTPDAETTLIEHPWPGNVRELRNVLERAIIFAKDGQIGSSDLILTTAGGFEVPDDTSYLFLFNTGGTLEELEHAYIRHILQTTDESYAEISRILGISKKTLWEKRKRYNLDAEVNR